MSAAGNMSVSEAVERFVTHKRAAKRVYVTEASHLRLFGRVMAESGVHDVRDLTTDAVHAFVLARRRGTPRSHNHLINLLKRFFAFSQQHELLSGMPLSLPLRRVSERRVPFIFGRPEAARLLQVAAALPDNNRAPRRGATYATIYALMYGLGLRASEAAHLTLADVDLRRDILHVRDSKFGKSRLLPFGPRLSARLTTFTQQRAQQPGGRRQEAPLFTFTRGAALNPGTISQAFRQLVPKLDLIIPTGVANPTSHSLRHSFAVGTLLRWYRQGVNPNQRLQHLSTFMGHTDIASTSVYLTITHELLEAAAQRYELHAAPHSVAAMVEP